jgi:predicted S18 family serine protease
MKSNYKIITVAGAATAAGLLTAEFDTLGFSYASIAFVDGTSPTTHGLSTVLTNQYIQHSDTAGSGHAAISGFVPGTDWTPSSAAVATNVAKVVYNVDLRGRKRYLKVQASAGGAMTTGALVCTLTNPADGRTTAAEIGAGAVVNG